MEENTEKKGGNSHKDLPLGRCNQPKGGGGGSEGATTDKGHPVKV